METSAAFVQPDSNMREGSGDSKALTLSGQVLKYQHLKIDDEKISKKIGLCSFPVKFGDTKIQIFNNYPAKSRGISSDT